MLLPKPRLIKLIFNLFMLLNLLVIDFFLLIKNNNKVMVSDVLKEQTKITITPSITITSTPLPTTEMEKTIVPESRTTVTRELYLPIGSGNTKSSSWVSLDGAEIAVDTSKYGNIKEAYFQASLRIPTGNGTVTAKLYNVTDKHDVWFSEVSQEGFKTGIKEAKIDIVKGSKIYKVYLKSTLEAEAVLDLARLKLIVEE